MILFHRDLDSHPVLTLAESRRTGDDLGRFRLQHHLGKPVFGFHGSFILVRNDVEREVGFDFRPSVLFGRGRLVGIGSNGTWATFAMGRRVLPGTVDKVGKGLLKQRARWFMGLVLVVRHSPASMRYRITLALSMLAMSISFTGWLVTLASLVVGVRLPIVIYVVANVTFSVNVALYAVGLELNLQQRAVPLMRRLIWHLRLVVLVPVFLTLESVAVIYAIFRPPTDFHVVQK